MKNNGKHSIYGYEQSQIVIELYTNTLNSYQSAQKHTEGIILNEKTISGSEENQ